MNFEQYYRKRHQGKCISFATHMATCLLIGRFNERTVKQIEVSGLQALVLLAFNNKNRLSYEDLEQITGLQDKELNIQLISLATMEHKVLKIIKEFDNVAKVVDEEQKPEKNE